MTLILLGATQEATAHDSVLWLFNRRNYLLSERRT
jgi:hypothetical protein